MSNWFNLAQFGLLFVLFALLANRNASSVALENGRSETGELIERLKSLRCSKNLFDDFDLWIQHYGKQKIKYDDDEELYDEDTQTNQPLVAHLREAREEKLAQCTKTISQVVMDSEDKLLLEKENLARLMLKLTQASGAKGETPEYPLVPNALLKGIESYMRDEVVISDYATLIPSRGQRQFAQAFRSTLGNLCDRVIKSFESALYIYDHQRQFQVDPFSQHWIDQARICRDIITNESYFAQATCKTLLKGEPQTR